MSLSRAYRRGDHPRRDGRLSFARNNNTGVGETAAAPGYNFNCYSYPYNHNLGTSKQDMSHNFSQNFVLDRPNYDYAWNDVVPSSKRRKLSTLSRENTGPTYQQRNTYVNQTDQSKQLPFYFNAYCDALIAYNNSSDAAATRTGDGSSYGPITPKPNVSWLEDDEVVFMSKDEIERCSPSRKDGIDVQQETHLRYSYCTFLQNLGFRLDIPQSTIGTAMVLCHRFFARRSHALHDRFLIATSALFLASKSEETPRPLNDVLKVSCEIFHKQDFAILSYMFPIDWFEQYRERITEAEQLILTTLNFELTVQHPYDSLTSTLQKVGFAQSILVNLALHLVSEGVNRGLALHML